MTKAYDIIVIGDDEASLCAAAAAAQHGVHVAILSPPRKAMHSSQASFVAVPNFVWRRFDLHDYGLALEPASARVTLTNDNTGYCASRSGPPSPGLGAFDI